MTLCTPEALALRVAELGPARLAPLIALDHDGTLSPIASSPDAAVLEPGAGPAVTRLARTVPVAILSGRGLDDLTGRLGGSPVTIVSEHGLRCRHADGTIEQFAPPLDEGALALLRAELHDLLGDQPDWLIEDKGVGIAVHHRLVSPDRREPTLSRVRQLLERAGTGTIQTGHAVIELRQTGADKGLALRRLIERFAGRAPVMVGDDATDEPALAAAEEVGGIGVLVAEEPRESAASTRLRSPREVVRFLELLGDLLEDRVRQG
jgi:trehalose 6-phosphate phosphatase